MGSVAIIVNQQSGSADSRGTEPEGAVRQAGLEARILRTRADELVTTAERAAADGCILVAAGGDGTVSTIASVAARTHATFGVIPLGTLNHFARDAGIPLDPADAATTIADGYTRDLDVGTIDRSMFVNNVSLGLYPRLVWERHREQHRGRRKWTAFAVALLRTWQRYSTVTVSLEVDGVSLVRHSPFVFIGNGEYQAEGVQLGRRSRIADGKLSIYLAPGVDRIELLALPIRALAGRLSADVRFEKFDAREVTVESLRPTFDVAVDGELRTDVRSPLQCTLLPRALRTLVPRSD
jgi:diacylglycerol kinase family enzyme